MICRTLCDIKQSGKLNSEQFALSMWLINQKLQGIDPPPALTPEMVPPSFRTKPPVDGVIVSTTKFHAIYFLDKRFYSDSWFLWLMKVVLLIVFAAFCFQCFGFLWSLPITSFPTNK